MSLTSVENVVTQNAYDTLLNYVDSCIDKALAMRMDGPFDKNELFYVVEHLGNERTPGLDGVSKEFDMYYWEELSHIIVGAINEIWSSQCMNHLHKQGIIKLLPKTLFLSKLSH